MSSFEHRHNDVITVKNTDILVLSMSMKAQWQRQTDSKHLI